MTDKNRLKREQTLLSYLVTYPERARDVMRRAAIVPAMFADPACRAAFAALIAAASNDDVTLLRIAAEAMPALRGKNSVKQVSAFLGLSDDFLSMESDVLSFADAAIVADHAEQIRSLFAETGMQPDILFMRSEQIAAETKVRRDALHAVFENAAPVCAKNPDDSSATDESLLHMPGLVDELVECSMRAAHRPNRALSFAGAISLLAHLAGRKFVGPNAARPNLYIIALANSGVGKEAPRTFNRNIAQYLRMEVSVLNGIASGQGLEDALKRTPALLCQIDEFDTLLNVLKDDRGNKQSSEAMWSVMLSVFTSSGSDHSTRVKAVNGRTGSGGEIVYNPSLSIFATALPRRFYQSLCERALSNGLLARCLVLESGQRGERNPSAGFSVRDLPESVLMKCRLLANMGRRFNDNVPVDSRDLVNVVFADGAAEEVQKVDDASDALYRAAERSGDEMAMSIWNRSVELVMKLSLLYAISECIGTAGGFAISPDAVRWAWRLVRPMQQRMLAMAEEYTSENPMDEKVKKFLRIVRRAGRRGVDRSKVSSQVRNCSPRELDDIEDVLVERGDIIVRQLPPGRNGKSVKLYVSTKSNGKRG